MFNIKNIFAGAVIATAALCTVDAIAPHTAKAAECFRDAGYRICFNLVAQNGSYNQWNVGFQNAHTTEYMRVTCYGKSMDSWRSNGGLNQAEASYLARSFCSF